MFVIYTPVMQSFLWSAIDTKPLPHHEWSRDFDKTSLISNLEDAEFMAHEVQHVRRELQIFHLAVQVLEILPNGLPDFNHPVFELPEWRKVS